MRDLARSKHKVFVDVTDVMCEMPLQQQQQKKHVCNMKYKFSSVKLQAVKYHKAEGVVTLWGKLAEEENKKHSFLS